MAGFRIFIDIPLGPEQFEEDARHMVFELMDRMSADWRQIAAPYYKDLDSGVPSINYRLGHDDDRQKSNYLEKTPSGHVSNRKSKI